MIDISHCNIRLTGMAYLILMVLQDTGKVTQGY